MARRGARPGPPPAAGPRERAANPNDGWTAGDREPPPAVPALVPAEPLAEAQLAAILEGVADGIIARRPDGRIVYANQAAARQMGIDSAAELLAMPAEALRRRFEIFGEDGRPYPPEQLTSELAAEGRESAPLTLRYRALGTAEDYWSISRSRPIFDTRGEVALIVTIFHDVTALKQRELAHRMLAEAGRVLSSTLDYEQRLRTVARLAVPLLADWCAVDLREPDGSIRLATVEHVDPTKVALAWTWRQRYPVDPDAPVGVAKVIRTGESEWVPQVTPAMIDAIEDPEIRSIVRQVGFQSVMIVPLMARGHIYGAASFVWAETGRHYSAEDLALAEELALRAGLAVDNARLHEALQSHNAALESAVARRTAALRRANERLEAEVAERRRAEAQLRVTLESAPDAIVIADDAGLIVQLNAEAERMFGYRASELVGHRIEVLVPGRFRSGHRREREAFMAEPVTRPMAVGQELWARRRDGSEIPVEIRLSPLPTERGTWVMSAIRDIRDRLQAEADLVEMRRRLVEGREAERLHLAQELHDGPVQGLIGLSYQLAALSDAVSSRDRARRIAALRDGLREVTDMLRATCGELRPPALAPFGLEVAIRSRLDRLAAERPDLLVTADLTPDRQRLSGRERLALYRIFQEAVANILRHSGARQVAVTLELDAEQVTLELSDDGRGFVVPRRWVQLVRDGHLGLAGATERAEALGGRLWVHSEPGRGTRIVVTLPLPEAEAEDEAEAGPTGPASAG